MAHVWISLEQDEDGYPPYDSEQLHTTELDGGLHRLDAPPVFAAGLAVGDVLGVESADEGELWVTHVAEEGDRWCSRVVPLNGFPTERIVEVLTSMGATAAATPYGLVTADFGPEVDAEHVLAELRAGRAEGDWDFDLGVGSASSE